MDMKIASTNLLFIEESVFLTDGFQPFLKSLFGRVQGKKLTIYLDPLILHSLDNYKLSNMDRLAYTIEGFIDILTQAKVLEYMDTKGYFNFAPFMSLVHELKTDCSVMVLTQKDSVFHTIEVINNEATHVVIAKLDKYVVEWNQAPIKTEDAFYVTKDTNYINKVNITNIDYVYSSKYGYLKLDKSKSFKGGEGILFKSYNNLLCKLYFEEHQTYVNYKKLEQMLELDIFNPFINWPEDILYYKNDFVGYVIEEVKNAVSLDILRINNFPGYSLFDIFKLSYNLLLNIEYLHQKDILIGDLKLDNILVKSADEVHLVDCGCYQIQDYSCDVCHPEYTKRIYTSEELKMKLRSVEDEYYPINKILFELLIRKNPNYNRNSGEVDVENKESFYYPLDLTEIKTFTPDLQLWSILTPRMREFFYYYFKENRVTYIPEWLYEIELFMKSAMAERKGEKVS